MDRSYPPERSQRFLRHLQRGFGFPEAGHAPPVQLEEIRLRPSLLDDDSLEALASGLPPGGLRDDPLNRVSHSLGKSYRDLVRLRRGEIAHPPDAVAYPGTPEQVRRLLARAAEMGAAVVPFGGGTSVVGGIEGPPGRPYVVVDLRELSAMVDLDRTSGTATFQAGILGPDLERLLGRHGLTLGHFPQSFEFSTLGGWVATRSAGQASTYYGRIENMVQSLRVELPDATYRSARVPASAAGPDLQAVMIGSEGILGVLTEITVRVHPLPDSEQWRAWYMPRFPDAVDALRRMVQRGLTPTVARLSDPAETRFLLATEAQARGGVLLWLGNAVLAARARREEPSLLILSFEGPVPEVDAAMRSARSVMKQAGGVELGPSPARAWASHRFELPFLRDDLLEAGIMVETLETATTWSNLLPLHRRLTQAVQGVLARGQATPAVLAHLSHLYPDGASLYLTCVAPQEEGRELDQWRELKHAACKAITEGGGTLSHHHGIGVDHAPWMEKEVGAAGLRMLRGLKRELDPGNVLNPGRLLPPEE